MNASKRNIIPKGHAGPAPCDPDGKKTTPQRSTLSHPLIEATCNCDLSAVLAGDDRWGKIVAASELSALPERESSRLQPLIGRISDAILRENDTQVREALLSALENGAVIGCDMSPAYDAINTLLTGEDLYIRQTALFMVNTMISRGADIRALVGSIAQNLVDTEQGDKLRSMIARDILRKYVSRGPSESAFVLESLSALSSDDGNIDCLRSLCRRNDWDTQPPPPMRKDMPTMSDAEHRDTLPAPPDHPAMKEPMTIKRALSIVSGNSENPSRNEAIEFLVSEASKGRGDADFINEEIRAMGPQALRNADIQRIRNYCLRMTLR